MAIASSQLYDFESSGFYKKDIWKVKICSFILAMSACNVGGHRETDVEPACSSLNNSEPGPPSQQSLQPELTLHAQLITFEGLRKL